MNTFNHGWNIGFGSLILLLIISLIFYVFENNKKETSSAQDILNKRYANGGIDKEEYREKSRLLREQNIKG